MNEFDQDELIRQAQLARENAYCPYSHFPVGAAIAMDNGEIITGVNVENVSFGATNCAERSAIFTAIGRGHQPKTIQAIAVSGQTEDFLPPCSVCRQVMVEMCDSDTPVYLTRNDGEILCLTVGELVPFAFTEMTE